MPYDKLSHLLAVFEAIPAAQRDHVLFGVVPTHADPANHTPIHLWVIDGGKRTGIELNGDGAILPPLNQDWAARHLDVQTDQPKHSLQVAAGFWLAIPDRHVVSLQYIRDGMQQTHTVMKTGARAVGGYLATFMVPSIRHVKITLEGCCTGTVTLKTAAGETILGQDAHGDMLIPDTALADGVAGTLTASAPIKTLDPL